MELHVLGSGSKGNCYLLTSSTGHRLLIELGVEWPKIQEALDWNYDGVHALISHAHSDHSRCFLRFANVKPDVYLTRTTFDEIVKSSTSAVDTDLLLTQSFVPYDPFLIESFMVVAFPLHHDVECMGFLIFHPECGTICFITDTMKAETVDGKPFDFKGVNHWIVEANYCNNILLNNVANGMNPMVAERVVKSHFSVQNCEQMLVEQDLSVSQNICLIHLSNGNSNAREFKERIEKATGIPTCIAEAGLKLNLDIW